MKPTKAVSDYMSEIGKKGGAIKGPQKRRSKAHYAAMVKARKRKADTSSDG